MRDPKGATESLAKLDGLAKIPLETARFNLNVEQALLSRNVQENGMSSVTPARGGARSLEMVAQAMGLHKPTNIEKYYDGSFLPPKSERPHRQAAMSRRRELLLLFTLAGSSSAT